MDTIQELAVEMKAVLQESGWHQGAMRGPDGSLDILGARDMALFGKLGDVPDHPLRFDFNRVAFGLLGGDVSSLSTWNDASGRTLDDVLALLDQIASLTDGEVHQAILDHAKAVSRSAR